MGIVWGTGLGTYTSMILSKKYPDKKFNLVLISAPKLGNINLSKYIEDTKNIKCLYSKNEWIEKI